MGHHIKNGNFKSDKYSWCPEEFLALKFSDPIAREAIMFYAKRTKDPELAKDLIEICEKY